MWWHFWIVIHKILFLITISGDDMAEDMKKRKIDICQDQEGHKGRRVDLMHTMHFDAFAIHILLIFKIFFNFGINFIFAFTKILTFIIPFWDCYRCGDTSKLLFGKFFFSMWQHDTNKWLRHKQVTPYLGQSCQNQIFTKFYQLYDMSETCLRLSQLRCDQLTCKWQWNRVLQVNVEKSLW